MKTFWTIFLTLIIAGGLAGGGIYYYMNQKMTTDKNNLQSQIDDLNAKITADTAADTANTNTSTTTTTTTTTAPTADPASVVTSFYNWYNDSTNHSSLVTAPGGSQAFQTWYNTALSAQGSGGGADPIVCAQDTPPTFTATTLSKDATAAQVSVTENFSPAQTLTVTLKASGGSWLLSSVTCPTS